jgi:hypothetical protein
VFGQRIVIINSAEVATDLLDRRGAIYSSRPVLQMGGEMVGWKETFILLRYGERLRNSRRLAHQLFGTQKTVKQFHSVMDREGQKYLARVVKNPDRFLEYIQK